MIKNFRTDQGQEYCNKKVEKICIRNSIRKAYSTPVQSRK